MPQKSVAKSPQKVTLVKSRASEILSGLHIAPSERQHAKRAIAAAKNAAPAAEVSGKTSELRVSVRAVRKSAKSKK